MRRGGHVYGMSPHGLDVRDPSASQCGIKVRGVVWYTTPRASCSHTSWRSHKDLCAFTAHLHDARRPSQSQRPQSLSDSHAAMAINPPRVPPSISTG